MLLLSQSCRGDRLGFVRKVWARIGGHQISLHRGRTSCEHRGMDVYEISVDLRPGVRDTEFVRALEAYLGGLVDRGHVESWRLLRRKLGLGAGQEFKVLIETRDLAQLDDAFRLVSTRADPVEEQHQGVNSLVVNFSAALYRDFPDPHRASGSERF